jgi:hypothetical protein
LIHNKGIKVERNIVQTILKAKPLTNKKEFLKFYRSLGYLGRFIANLIGKIKVFIPLFKLKSERDFK